MRLRHSWSVLLCLASLSSWAGEPHPSCPKGTLLQSDTHPGGSLRRCMREIRHGKRQSHGPFVEMDARGVVLRRGEFTHGTPSGTWTTFHPNGKRKSEGGMQGSTPQGLWTEWYEDGRVMARKEYEQGRVVRLNGRPASGFGEDSEDAQAFYVQRAPQVAIVRVTALLADMPRAMDPGTVVFEVVEPLKGKPVGRFAGPVMSLSSTGLKVGTVALAGLAPEPYEDTPILGPPHKFDGYVTGVIPVTSVEEARKRARKLVP